MESPFNIGQAATATGLSAKMIRHYEHLGLLPPAARTGAGYRQYGSRAINMLLFIRHSRDLGFSLEQIRELLVLWQDRSRPSRKVKALAQRHIAELEQKLQELQDMKATLQSWVNCCHGDDQPDCPIIESLAARPAHTKPVRTKPNRIRTSRA